MAELQIARLEARYHLPPSRQDEKQRLDRLLEDAAGEALEAGLERLGLSGEGELCIREVKVPLRLQLGRPDDALVLAWADAMAAAIETSVRAGDGDMVLRYGSRREALADFASGVARGDGSRGWAWQQLGLCEEDEATAAGLARALAAEPEALVPVLVAVAEAGWLPQLARRFETAWWPQLAALALTSVGWSSVSFAVFGQLAAEAAEGPDRPGAAGAEARGSAGKPGTRGRQRTDAADAADRVDVAGADDRAGAGPAGGLRPEEPDPDLAGLPVGLARALAPILQRLGLSAAALPELRRSRLSSLFEILQAPPASPLGQALAALVWLEVDPGKLQATAAASRSALLAATASVLAPEAPARAAAGPSAILPARRASAEVPEQDAFTSRRLGFTEWGGLLFLVGVADDLGLPEEVAAHPVLGRRPGRWVWHQLALALVPTTAEDPAALAFAGLLPGNKSPAFETAPASEEEQIALAALAEGLLEETVNRSLNWVRGRLARSPSGEERAGRPRTQFKGGSPRTQIEEEIRDRVCRRSARVLADPGWIEIRFSLDDVDTGLRRARLDLDPGFVPWLGVVLRFVYE